MFTSSQGTRDAAGPPRKRNLFKNRPAWAKVNHSVAPVAVDEDPFSRTKETYARLEQEKRLRDKEKAGGKYKKDQVIQPYGHRSTKRRRTDESSDDDASASEKNSSVKQSPRVKRTNLSLNTTPPPTFDSKSKTGKLTFTKSPLPRDPIIIDVDEDSTEEGAAPQKNFWSPMTVKPRKHQPMQSEVNQEEPTSSESESERLGKEARGRLKRSEQRKSKNTTPPPDAPVETKSKSQTSEAREEEPSGSDAEYERLAAEARDRLKRKGQDNKSRPLPSILSTEANEPVSIPSSAQAAPTPVPDPIIKLFIHSRIPNTNPLIVNIRLGQRLKEVRMAWLSRQPLTAKQKDDVFFTWRRNRIFDFTTCKSLGVNVDEDGEVYIRGQTQLPGVENTQLEMEATTMEILEEDKKLKEKPLDASPVKAAADVPSIKIILKAKGLEDYKLVVKPTTKFGQIASVFRRIRKIAPEKSVSLVFDGEKLDEEEEMRNSEVADMDNIEVHIK